MEPTIRTEQESSIAPRARSPAVGTILLKWFAFTLLFGGLLFACAGRFDLPMVWAFVGTYSALLLAFALVTARRDPDLLEERRRTQPGTKEWDKRWLKVYNVVFFAFFVLAGLDAGRISGPGAVPLGLQIASLLCCLVAFGLVWWVTAVNTFFSRNVRIQDDRGHRVVTTGPYHYVRHPGYAGNIVGWPSAALAIGSWWALIPAAVVVLLFVWRTANEDRTLHEELDGYADYAQKARYRLLPGVW